MLSLEYMQMLREKLRSVPISELCLPEEMKLVWLQFGSTEDPTFEVYSGLHSHAFCEVQMSLCGEFSYADGNQPIRICNGQGLLIAPGAAHRYIHLDTDYLKCSLAFSVEIGSDLYQRLTMQKFRRFDICNRLTSALDAVLKGLKEDLSSKTILEQGISQAVEVILEQIGIPLSEKAAQPVLEDERVAMAKQYICENLHRMLSCEVVAQHCGLSAKQLNRIFLRCVGMTIFGYTKMVRLQKCEELLLTSGDSIKEISSRLGFQNTYYFSNFFKRNYGIPPAYFRNKNANLGSLKGEKEKNYG